MGNYQVMHPLQQVQQEQAGLMGHQKLPKLGSWALFWRISGLLASTPTHGPGISKRLDRYVN